VRIEGIAYQELLEDLRENFLTLWPHGVTESGHQDKWRASFSGNPWTSSGTELTFARRMLVALYRIIGGQGYSYLTTVNTSSASSRLVFTQTMPEITYYFIVSVSPSGDKISIVDGPQELLSLLDARIRSIFPRKIASSRYTEDGVYKIELKRSFGGGEADKGHFAGFILMFFKEHGFMLNGSIPMGKSRSPLTFGARKETWIFRSMRPPESGKGH